MLTWVAIALSSGLRTHVRNLSTRFHEGPKALAGLHLMRWKASNREGSGMYLCKNVLQGWGFALFGMLGQDRADLIFNWDYYFHAIAVHSVWKKSKINRWSIRKTFLHVWSVSHMKTTEEFFSPGKQKRHRRVPRDPSKCVCGVPNSPFFLVGGGWFWQPLSRWSSVARGRYRWTISIFLRRYLRWDVLLCEWVSQH